jgi:fructose-specific phosphotransferase system IIC component
MTEVSCCDYKDTTVWRVDSWFITEGAIPFAAADPIRVIPSMMIGSGVGGAIALDIKAETTVPITNANNVCNIWLKSVVAITKIPPCGALILEGVGGAIALALGSRINAPHGGIFVIATTDFSHILQTLLALVIGHRWNYTNWVSCSKWNRTFSNEWCTHNIVRYNWTSLMMAIDMGGPFNKAAYVFATAALTEGNAAPITAAMGITRIGSAAANGIAPSVMNDAPIT